MHHQGSRHFSPLFCPRPQSPATLHRHHHHRRTSTYQLDPPSPHTTAGSLQSPHHTPTATTVTRYHGTTITTKTTAATAVTFPAVAATVAGCGWQNGHHRRGGANETFDFLFVFSMHGGYIDCINGIFNLVLIDLICCRIGAVRRQTTTVVAVRRRYNHHSRTMWCRAKAVQSLRVPHCAQPFDATAVAATEPAVATTATTAAPWWCWACGGDPPFC
nr:hypothetical protein [Tanacetum cinerariifolium]